MNQSHADPVARWAAVICSQSERSLKKKTHHNDEPFFSTSLSAWGLFFSLIRARASSPPPSSSPPSQFSWLMFVRDLFLSFFGGVERFNRTESGCRSLGNGLMRHRLLAWNFAGQMEVLKHYHAMFCFGLLPPQSSFCRKSFVFGKFIFKQ